MATTFRDRLIEAQLESGVSARQIAIRAGIEPSHFSRLGSGGASPDAVRWEIAKALATALGVEVMWLMEGREPKRATDYAPPSNHESPRERFRRLAAELGFRPEIVDYLMKRYASTAYDNAEKYTIHWWYTKARNRDLRDRALRHEVAAKHYARTSQKVAESAKEPAPKSSPARKRRVAAG